MTASTARPTVASLAVEVADLKGSIAQILALVSGQPSTPAPVAEAVKTSTSKGKKGSKKVEPKASTKVPMPEAVKEGFATVKNTAEDIRPLNKALDWKGDNAGKKATDRPQAEIKTALAKIAAEQGKDVAAKALAAYKARKAAAEKRAAK